MIAVSHSLSHLARNSRIRHWACRENDLSNQTHAGFARRQERRRVTGRNTWPVPPASTRYQLMATASNLLTIREAQIRLGVSRSTIYRLLEVGELHRLYIRTSPRITQDSLESFLARREHLGDRGKVVIGW